MTAGFYNGFTFGWPTPIGGVGGGLYADDHGGFYPQAYYGTPRYGASTGYSPDLENFLTGPSVSGNFGTGSLKYNIGASGSSAGAGFGTPGVGVTYGFGPYHLGWLFDSPPSTVDAAGEVNPAIYSTGFDGADRQEPFRNRFGRWNSTSADDAGDTDSPLLRALQKYRRPAAPAFVEGTPPLAPSSSNNSSTPIFDSSNPPPIFAPSNYYAAPPNDSIQKWIASLAGVDPDDPVEFSPSPIFAPLYGR